MVLDLPAPFGPMTDVKFIKGPTVCLPRKDLKLSTMSFSTRTFRVYAATWPSGTTLSAISRGPPHAVKPGWGGGVLARSDCPTACVPFQDP